MLVIWCFAGGLPEDLAKLSIARDSVLPGAYKGQATITFCDAPRRDITGFAELLADPSCRATCKSATKVTNGFGIVNEVLQPSAVRNSKVWHGATKGLESLVGGPLDTENLCGHSCKLVARN